MNSLHRRGLLRTAVGGGALLVIGPRTGVAQPASSSASPGASPVASPAASPVGAGAFAAEVDAGLAYLRGRAAEQTSLAERLLAAIEGGNTIAARNAYVAARPPYEEIEVLAASFPETDEAIDARPYALEGGETNPAYVSVHRIEALLFRDEDLEAALPVARGLVASTRRLEGDLRRREAFSAGQTFEGMIGLANEIASKKISSEEETWSDQSLLIFHHNWLGIWSQYAPFAPVVAAADPDAAAMVDAALAAAMATIAAYPPAADGAFPPYGAVPAADRGRIVRASYGLASALTAAGRTLAIL